MKDDSWYFRISDLGRKVCFNHPLQSSLKLCEQKCVSFRHYTWHFLNLRDLASLHVYCYYDFWHLQGVSVRSISYHLSVGVLNLST